MWMKIDDQLNAHRKTRAVLRSNPGKRRDASAMGLWVLAGSWAAQNLTDGWVPAAELDRWDDDWEALTERLVSAGYWWPEDREGEDGYGFNDWQEWNNPDGASASGTFGNHVRWHVNKGVVKPECEHCPTEPSEEDIEPESPPESDISSGRYRGDDRGDIARSIGANRLPVPDPTRPEPENTPCASADAECATRNAQADPVMRIVAQPQRFEEFWKVYDKKRDRKRAEQKYRLALKKPGVTDNLLIVAAGQYIAAQKAKGKHPEFTKNADTWLNGECWNDETRPAKPTHDPDSWMRRRPGDESAGAW